ncbi:MAG TPA: universal stress protein [Anaeromyxobacteraceae bacterium]|nr:universal stress protein [Anaeromyxobacteraceae bacterium]
MQALRQLVSGTDFSACAEHALERAIELALAASARITLVHVHEPGDDDLDDRRLLQCEAALSEVVSRHRRRGVDLTGVLRSGKPWTKLDNVAVEVGANLIVVGRHGAGRGRSVDLGSVADRLVRAANRPVLTVACGCDPDHTCSETEEANASF